MSAISNELNDDSVDYESLPVIDFGVSALKRMGWKEGSGIGLSNKELFTPIELLPHPPGLGLGAVHKPKAYNQKSSNIGHIRDSNEKVKHYKGLDEVTSSFPVVNRKLNVNSYISVVSGPHKGLIGKILEINDQIDIIKILLTLNESKVSLSTKDVISLSLNKKSNISFKKNTVHPNNAGDNNKKNNSFGLIIRKNKANFNFRDSLVVDNNVITINYIENNINSEHNSRSYKLENQSSNKKRKISRETSSSTPNTILKNNWLRRDLKVRMISKSFYSGRFYNCKLRVLDVTTPFTCFCQSEKGELLEGVKQNQLETVVPKDKSLPVMILTGDNIGQIGYIYERYPELSEAIVFLEDRETSIKFSYNDICVYVGTEISQ